MLGVLTRKSLKMRQKAAETIKEASMYLHYDHPNICEYEIRKKDDDSRNEVAPIEV